MLAALEFEAGRVGDQLAALLAATSDSEVALLDFADGLAATLELSDYRLGCPITTSALELSAIDDAVRNLCARVYGEWQGMIRDHLAASGVDEADGRAELILSAIEGPLILARVNRDGEIVRRVGRQLAKLAH